MKTMSNFYPRPVALCLIWLVWLCSALPGFAQQCPGSLYAVGDGLAAGFNSNQLYIIDPVSLQPTADYTLTYTGLNGSPGSGTNAIATPGDGFAYTVSRDFSPPGNNLARTIHKTNLATGVTTATSMVLPDIAVVNITGTSKGDLIYLYNETGKLVVNASTNGTPKTINLSGLTSGLYILVIQRNNEKLLTEKIIQL